MDPVAEIVSNPLGIAAIGAGLILALLGIIWLIRVRRCRRTIENRLQRCCIAMLADFVISDSNEGEIHIHYALLTSTGVVILDLKDVEGHVFGSDGMDDWTVISDKRRFTFSNPQHALYDRVAAVARIIPEVPVEGYVAFSGSAVFSKGLPDQTIMLETLLNRLEKNRGSHSDSALDAFSSYWDRLRDEAVSTRLDMLLRK